MNARKDLEAGFTAMRDLETEGAGSNLRSSKRSFCNSESFFISISLSVSQIRFTPELS